MAVCYDYILTFSREVDLIWVWHIDFSKKTLLNSAQLKPWSTMTTLFIATRYLGLAIVICAELSCTGMFQFNIWAMFIYHVTAKAIMILRVSAMFKRPRRVICIISFIYLLVTIEAFVIDFLFEGPRNVGDISISPVTVPIVNITLCSAQVGRSPTFLLYGFVPGILYDLFLLSLALYGFAVHLRDTRENQGKTGVNVYMRLLFEHSILYFFFSFAYNGLSEGLLVSPSAPMTYAVVATLYCNSALFILYPRLVLSFKGHRSQSDGLHVGSSTDGTPSSPSHSHSHSASSTSPTSGGYAPILLKPLKNAAIHNVPVS
ncbi:hypothetical protein BU15DRAFT_77322 [Melanogaster broomeanus]|nr:hypothetical protein BU15DRAFT_77322 [Melanogaster broomeanus]